jgi:hypothetical protein
MSESVSSSSSPLPASASSLCETDQETLREEYDLKSADPCPVCTLPIGRHLRRFSTLSASTAVSTASSHSSFQLGKNTVLPKWRVDHRHAKPFLDHVEHHFIADGVHKSVWPRLLLKAISNVNESSWVMKNIVEPGVDWTIARTLFINHFEVFSYTELLQKDYQQCKQGPKESVQLYCDRFMELISQLRYEDSTEQVILHFLEGLHNSTQGKIREHIRSMRRLQSSLQKMQGLSIASETQSQVLPVYEIKSLMEMVDIALDIDRSNQISTSTLTSSSTSSLSSVPFINATSSTETLSSSQKKSCIHHPGATSHTTAECRTPLFHSQALQPASNTSSTIASGPSSSDSGGGPTVRLHKDGKPIKCFICGGNHFSNEPSCPSRSDRTTRSAAAAKQNSNTPTSSVSSSHSSSSTSSSVAPFTALPTSTQASISGNAITITGGREASSSPSIIHCGSVSLSDSVSSADRTTAVIPAQLVVSFMMKFNDLMYSTFIDTGAEVSFVDASLVTLWDIPIVPPQQGGKIRMANTSITDRYGSAQLEATALFPATDRGAISFRCSFELMPIGKNYHFIIGRDLIPLLFPERIIPLAYFPRQTSSSVTVVASSTLVDFLDVSDSSSDNILDSLSPDGQPDSSLRLDTSCSENYPEHFQRSIPIQQLNFNSFVHTFLECFADNSASNKSTLQRAYRQSPGDPGPQLSDTWNGQHLMLVVCPYLVLFLISFYHRIIGLTLHRSGQSAYYNHCLSTLSSNSVGIASPVHDFVGGGERCSGIHYIST